MKTNKLITVLFICFATVFFLAGTAIACQAGRLGYFLGGTEVEGTVYDYEVRYSSGSEGRGGYHCYLFCRYEDESGKIYTTEFQYNLTNATREDAEKYGEGRLNKPIKIYIRGSGCVSGVETERYAPYVAVCVSCFVAGAAFAVIPPTVKAVRKKRKQKPDPTDEE